MEAYTRKVAERVAEPDTGSVEGDLAAFLGEVYRIAQYPDRVRALRGLMAEAQLDPAFLPAFREWVDGRRAIVVAMLKRGIDRGELRADVDLEHAVDLVFGPFWYRLLVEHAPLDPADAPRHAAGILGGFRG